jgi:hypothetical protein
MYRHVYTYKSHNHSSANFVGARNFHTDDSQQARNSCPALSGPALSGPAMSFVYVALDEKQPTLAFRGWQQSTQNLSTVCVYIIDECTYTQMSACNHNIVVCSGKPWWNVHYLHPVHSSLLRQKNKVNDKRVRPSQNDVKGMSGQVGWAPRCIHSNRVILNSRSEMSHVCVVRTL